MPCFHTDASVNQGTTWLCSTFISPLNSLTVANLVFVRNVLFLYNSEMTFVWLS